MIEFISKTNFQCPVPVSPGKVRNEMKVRSFKSVRESAIWNLDENVRCYERAKANGDRSLMEMYCEDVFNKVLFARTIGLISYAEADEYFVKIDKEYLLERKA